MEVATMESKAVEFSIQMPFAKEVGVAGNFNHWNPASTPLKKDRTGLWKGTINLPPGRYEYHFVADGQWIKDNSVPNTEPSQYGPTNTVLRV